MGKKYYKPDFGYNHVTAVYQALDKHNLPNHVKSLIFNHYKKSHRYKPSDMYREPTIYERVQYLRNVRRHGV